MTRHGYRALALILLGGIGLSALAAHLMQASQAQSAADRVRDLVDRQAAVAEAELRLHLEVLHGLKARLDGRAAVDEAGFRAAATRALRRHDSVRALAWAPRHLAEGEERYAVALLQPDGAEGSALGAELASDPARRAALAIARDTGDAVLIEPLTDAGPLGEASLIAVPVYATAPTSPAERRDRLAGFALLGFDTTAVLDAALRVEKTNAGPLALYVHDQTEPERATLVYQSVPTATALQSSVAYRRQLQTFAGRTWSLSAVPGEGFGGALGGSSHLLVFGAGLLITLALAGYVYAIQRHARRTEREVQLRTAQLQDSEARANAVINTAPSGIISIDSKGRIESVNPATERIFGYSAAEMIGKNVAMLMPEPYHSEHDGYISHYLATGEAKVINVGGREVLGRRKNGEQFHLDLAVSEMSVKGRRMFMGLVSDIDARVRAQQRLTELNAELLRLSSLDGLTGLANRRHFDRVIDIEWRRAVRERSPLSVLMVDVDHFKSFNDRYGHQAGDDCLRAVAQVLRQIARRPTDVVARYGGEEFVVLLPATAARSAAAIANRCCRGVRQLRIRRSASAAPECVTISVGVAGTLPGSEATPAELVQSADRALYQAKHAGRDRVVSATPLSRLPAARAGR